MGISQDQVGPINVRTVAAIKPSEISDRGLDGYIDAIFGVNTIYDSENNGKRIFCMKDGNPAVYYNGNPYPVSDCDGKPSAGSTDGNKYFPLEFGKTYYCLIMKNSTGDVKVKVKSSNVADAGYTVVASQLVSITPEEGTTSRPQQIFTGTFRYDDKGGSDNGVFIGNASLKEDGTGEVSFTNCYYKFNGELMSLTDSSAKISGLSNGSRIYLSCDAKTGGSPSLTTSATVSSTKRYELLGYAVISDGSCKFISNRGLTEMGLPLKGGDNTNLAIEKDSSSEQFKVDVYYK